MFKKTSFLAASVMALALVAGCETAPKTEAARDNLKDDAGTSLQSMQRVDANLGSFVHNGYGYAIFPDVGKGALVVGGAYGRGTVYEQGKMIGYADLKQATIGAQAGGQSYSELIVFENKAALDSFVNDSFEFSANASAVALKPGVSATAKFDKGVAVFTQPKGGLMFEASIGGQQFKFVGKNRAEDMKPNVTRTETTVETKTTEVK